MSDWHTAALYDFLPLLGISTVVNELSRWVADPNRAPASREVVAWRDFSGEALYDTQPSQEEVARRVAVAHAPYHDALSALINETLAAHGHAVLLDLHCFAVDLPADIVIGDRHATTASPDVVERVDAALSRTGFLSARNLRWTGGWIVAHYGARDHVDALQLELNARTYVNPMLVDQFPPLPPYDEDRFADTKARLTEALAAIAATFANPATRRL